MLSTPIVLWLCHTCVVSKLFMCAHCTYVHELILTCTPCVTYHRLGLSAQERHEKVCVNASKKRKPFDINKQRLSYLEGEHLPPSKSKTVSEIAVGVMCVVCIHCSTHTHTHTHTHTCTDLQRGSFLICY